MPLVSEQLLRVADVGLQLAGIAFFAWVAWRAARSGGWRDPLSPSAAGVRQLSLVFPFLAVASLYLLQSLAFLSARDFAGIDLISGDAPAPGTGGWLALQWIDGLTKLAVCGLMVFMLMGRGRDAVRRPVRSVTATLKIAVVAVLILMPIAYLQLQFTELLWQVLAGARQPPQHPVLESLELGRVGFWGIAALCFGALVVAPLSEELFFRGVLLQALLGATGAAWPAILVSACAFGVIHLNLPQAVLPLTTMGVILGILRLRTASLSICVLVHALFNGRTILVALLNPDAMRGGW